MKFWQLSSGRFDLFSLSSNETQIQATTMVSFARCIPYVKNNHTCKLRISL